MSFQAQRLQIKDHSSRMGVDTSRDRKTIKVLIPYDGSENSDVALSELRRAGLPEQFDALVAVTNVWLPSSPYEITKAVSARRLRALNAGVMSFAPALRNHEEQLVLSRQAEQRLSLDFPTATISTEAFESETDVANEVIRKTRQWGAELIIVGATTSPSLHITDYAGPALKIVREADCSVRIARVSGNKDNGPVRFIVGLLEPTSSAEIVERVAERDWPPETEAHLVVLRKPGPHDPTRDLRDNALSKQLAERLRATGLRVFVTTLDGQPEEALLSKAQELAVDCVFIDAASGSLDDGLSPLARAVAIGARCSVEVVRHGSLNSKEFKTAA